MKAIIQNQYGSPDVLVPGMTNPPLVSDHDVLVEIYASTVTQGDRRLSLRLILDMALNAIRPGPKAIFGIVESTPDDLKWVASRLANSKLKPTPIRTFSLSKSADAHRAFEREKLRGEIIIQVRQEAKAPRRLPNISSPLERVASA